MFGFIKIKLRPYLKKFREYREEILFRKFLAAQKNLPLKIVIGSSGIYQKGWVPTEAHFLNLLDENTWKKYFGENQISNMLAEHVWEHLTIQQGRIAAAMCYKFIKKGGRLRVAVPDGFHQDQKYIDYVKPGGHGAGADDHKVLYNYKTFSAVFIEAGFKTELLEYFDENKIFHAVDWNMEEGFIHRSIKHDERNINGEPVYTSLIIDAIKL